MPWETEPSTGNCWASVKKAPVKRFQREYVDAKAAAANANANLVATVKPASFCTVRTFLLTDAADETMLFWWVWGWATMLKEFTVPQIY